MAQADLLVELLRSARREDQVAIRRVAEALIQEERSKGHRIVADRLTRALKPEAVHPGTRHASRTNGSNGQSRDLVYEIAPGRSLESLVLPEGIRGQILEVVEEQHRSELLHAHNLNARHRLMFAGPPGNGKTTLAEALAYELMYPLVVVRYETLIGSYLGETAGRLKSVLDYVRTQRCVLLLDEFETLGKERGDTHETGEIKRVVSSLLLQIDQLPDYVVIVAASNHPELLDRAVWRRFQIRIGLPCPTRVQLANFVEQLSQRCQVDFGYAPETLAKHLLGQSFSETEEFCLGVARRVVLDQGAADAKRITRQNLERWRNRLNPTSSNLDGRG